MNWFKDLLLAELKRRGERSHSELAAQLGVTHSTINKWVAGVPNPKLSNVEALLKIVGGDINRALPGYNVDQGILELEEIGSCSAGEVQFTVEERKKIQVGRDLFSRSVFYYMTDGNFRLVRIDGDSMEPDMPDGSHVVVSAPIVQTIPSRTPVIFRDKMTDEMTLKLYEEKKGMIMGLPLNPENETHLWKKSEVTVDYVVLGVINPWRKPMGGKKPRRPLMLSDSIIVADDEK